MSVVVLVLLAALSLRAQHGSSEVVNPYTSPMDATAGASVYRGQCAGCHGIDGGGTGAGPALNSGTFRHGRADEALFRTITKGVPGTSMPPFSLGGRVTWQLVTHLRSLSVSTRTGAKRGSVATGAKLYAVNCSGCHTVQGKGGLVGPDLTDIAARRSEADLLDAMARPGAVVSSEYWSIVGTTKDGRKVRGIRLNEDTHSIQIRSTEGRLVSLLKKDLDGVELVRDSPMPAFQGKLTEAQMQDVVAFLADAAKEESR